MDRQDTSMGGPHGGMPPTCWTELMSLKQPSPENFRRVMESLALQYWKPVYRWIRLNCGSSGEDAKDLTQEFFAFLVGSDLWRAISPEKGRFRTYLKIVLRNFLRDAAKSRSARKRGGGQRIVSLQTVMEEARDLEPAQPSGDADAVFDREWARCLTKAAWAVAEERLRRDGQDRAAALFAKKYLRDPDSKEPEPTYDQLAAEAGVSRSDVNNLLSRARNALRAALDEKIREYVHDEGDVADERQHLFGP